MALNNVYQFLSTRNSFFILVAPIFEHVPLVVAKPNHREFPNVLKRIAIYDLLEPPVQRHAVKIFWVLILPDKKPMAQRSSPELNPFFYHDKKETANVTRLAINR